MKSKWINHSSQELIFVEQWHAGTISNLKKKEFAFLRNGSKIFHSRFLEIDKQNFPSNHKGPKRCIYQR